MESVTSGPKETAAVPLPVPDPEQTQKRRHKLSCIYQSPKDRSRRNGEMACEAWSSGSAASVGPSCHSILGSSLLLAPKSDWQKMVPRDESEKVKFPATIKGGKQKLLTFCFKKKCYFIARLYRPISKTNTKKSAIKSLKN